MSVADMESAIDEFVACIVNYIDAVELSDTNMHMPWQDLQSERKDPEMARFRRFEAPHGCAPMNCMRKNWKAAWQMLVRQG